MPTVDHLANEILSQIFVHWQTMERDQAPPEAFLRSLSGALVNKHWNTLINNTPELWSTVVIVLPEAPLMYNQSPQYWDRALQHAHRCISASAALPLTLVVASILEGSVPHGYDAFKPVNQRHMSRVRPLLIDNASRIETLAFKCLFNVGDHLLRYIEEQKMELPILRRCFFQRGHAYTDFSYNIEGAPGLGRIWAAPRLQHLSAALDSMQAAALPLHLPSLQKVELTASMTHPRLVDFLARAPNLERILVTTLGPPFAEPGPTQQMLRSYSNQLANLVTLGLNWQARQLTLTDLPTMPALQHAYLSTYGLPHLEPPENGKHEELGMISVFLRKHSESLRTLSIFLNFYGDRAAVEAEEVGILPHLPNLECLAFWSKGMAGMLDVWKHLLRIQANRDPSQPLLLPRASTFRHIWSQGFGAEELESFIDSNEFRQWVASRALEKMELLVGFKKTNRVEERECQQNFILRLQPGSQRPWVDVHILPKDAFTNGCARGFPDGEGLSLIEHAAIPSIRPEPWY